MENQHRKIAGYRELSQEEIDLMNKIKIEGVRIEALMKEANEHIQRQYANADKDEFMRLDKAEPVRFAALAKTNFQVALMELTRSIAQPTFF